MSQVGLVQGLSFGPSVPPASLRGLVRAAGAGLVRVQLAWGELEPEPGRFRWAALDRWLEALPDGGRLWVTVACASCWGTRAGRTGVSSPPHDPAAFAGFVTELGRRLGPLARYWQLESEPARPAGWAGGAEAYAELLGGFAGVVRAGAGDAVLVAGGATATGWERRSRAFFESVVARAAGAFDCFDLHLPGEPARIRGHFAAVRDLLATAGRDHVPLVVGEYGGADPAQLVTAQLLALSGGAAVACYAPGLPPAAAGPTLRMLAGALRGSTGARRIDVSGRPDVFVFDVEFAEPDRALQVFWREDEPSGAGTDLREALEWHWVHRSIHVAAADAEPVPMPAWASGRLAVPLSGAPVLVSTEPLGPGA